MTTIRDDLDWCQELLHDAPVVGQDGHIWTRAELLTWYVDGYRHLLAESQARRRFTVLPVPPRVTMSGTQAWERRATTGTFWQWTVPTLGGGWTVTHHWELEQLEGIAPTAASEGMTQPWERVFANPTYAPFRFVMRKDHGRIVKLWWNHALLHPVTVRELDAMDMQWVSLGGQPLAWTLGTGPTGTYEVFELVTTYMDTYAHTGTPHGMARELSGSRTYTVDVDPEASGGLAVGLMRGLTSPSRQYWPATGHPDQVMRGKPDWFASSSDTLLCLEVIVPDVAPLLEEDTPGLLPPQLQKYVRYYTLARAWNRTGPGYQPLLAALCLGRYQAGVAVMRRLAQVARKDKDYSRQPVGLRPRPPRPVLPSTYPSPWR